MSEHGKSVFDLDANLVALLCYLGNLVCALGLILSIIVVIQDKTNKLARFHAFQSIMLSVVGIVVGIALQIFTGIAAALDLGILALITVPIYLIFGLLMLVAIVFAAIKGFQGEIFKIPVIGNMAENWAG